MTFDEALQQFDQLDGLVPAGTRSRPTSPPPQLTPTGDVTIRDPRNYVPRARRTLPSLDHIMTLPPEEQTAALKALGIENRRLKMETAKLKKVTALRSGQADPGMVIPPRKGSMRGVQPIKRQKGKGYSTQLVGEQGAAPAPKGKGEQLADLVGGYIDEPRGTAPGLGNPTNPDDPRFEEFSGQLSRITGAPISKDGPYSPTQFGETYNPEEYRGLRFVLPESFGNEEGRVPGHDAMRQEFLGHMITRGYPVLGGVGQLPGFQEGFNPVGFGQRDLPAGADALTTPGARR